jgi:hypothetical protein
LQVSVFIKFDVIVQIEDAQEKLLSAQPGINGRVVDLGGGILFRILRLHRGLGWGGGLLGVKNGGENRQAENQQHQQGDTRQGILRREKRMGRVIHQGASIDSQGCLLVFWARQWQVAADSARNRSEPAI